MSDHELSADAHNQPKRRLAAIMFTDMVGYTALGQKNESFSLALVEEQRKLIRPILRRHDGAEIKTIGDAFLVKFASTLEAVRCAYDIQRAVREFNLALSEDQRLHIRIGIHVGDVVESIGDISGYTVNVASRIEPVARDGGVCVSRQVFDHVQNKFELPFTSIGSKTLKNVAAPLEIFEMRMPWQEVETRSPSILDKHRVAVLPFSNISPDPNDAYVSDGMTEELISTMSKIRGLNVLARTSVTRYKSGERNIEEIAREIKAGTIVEGSVRKLGDKIRVTIQVIDSATSEHIWSESYNREMKDIFDIQADISQTVAEAVKVKLLKEEKMKLRTEPTKNPEAHALYLRGVFYNMNEYTNESGLMNSVRCFERAIELDPSYASAYAYLSDSYTSLFAFGFWPSEKAFPLAEKTAKIALDLDPVLPEAYRSIALLKYFQGDWRGADAECRKAIELNPNDAISHSYLGFTLTRLKRLDEAAIEARAGLDLAPMERFTNQAMLSVLHHQRKYEEALSLLRRVVEVDPEFVMYSDYLGICYLQTSRYDMAIEAFRKSIQIKKSNWRLGDLGVAYVRSGNAEEALNILRDLQKSEHLEDLSVSMAVIEAALGRFDEAITLLEKGYGEHGPKAFGTLDFELNSDPLWDGLRSDPKFKTLLEKVSA